LARGLLLLQSIKCSRPMPCWQDAAGALTWVHACVALLSRRGCIVCQAVWCLA